MLKLRWDLIKKGNERSWFKKGENCDWVKTNNDKLLECSCERQL